MYPTYTPVSRSTLVYLVLESHQLVAGVAQQVCVILLTVTRVYPLYGAEYVPLLLVLFHLEKKGQGEKKKLDG